MKVLALFRQKNLPVLRRIIFPFSVLAERTQKFAFQQITDFDIGPGYSYDVVVLQNWILTDDEIEQCRTFLDEGGKYIINDITDISLLANIQVRKLMALCHYVTVPNEHMKKELESFIKSVRTVPSTLDVPFYMAGRNPIAKPKVFVIGCVGQHDWHLVKDALTQIRKTHPKVFVIGDTEAQEALGELVTHPITLLSHNYPRFLHNCDIGLCPREGMTGQDTIWAYEYGIAGKPVITSTASDYQHVMQRNDDGVRADFSGIQRVENKTDAWVKAIAQLLDNPFMRHEMGNKAFQYANAKRNTLQADLYLRAYTQFLPHLR